MDHRCDIRDRRRPRPDLCEIIDLTMKVQLLPSSFDESGAVSQQQRLTCFVINDSVAIDAGSLAFSCSDQQREQIRDIVISHTHLDHIAGLPIFVDDLFASLTEPLRIHVTAEMAEVLERDVFNWHVYPRFSELKNEQGSVLEYKHFEPGIPFSAAGLDVTAFTVNHNVSGAGFIVSDGTVSIGITGDTAETDAIWEAFSACQNLSAIFVECAFPDEMADLAIASHHLTPKRLAIELSKFKHDCTVYVSNIKAMYRDRVVRQINEAAMPNVRILEIGMVYDL